MAMLRCDDIEIYYELHGKGKPLVLISGYTCDHAFWSGMLGKLSENFQVLIFDNRAIGQTKDLNENFSLERMADDTQKLVQSLSLKDPIIIGQSMGGIIAQILAAKHSFQMSGLVILNSVSQFDTRALFALQSLLNLRKANTSFDNLVAATLPWVFSSDYLANPDNIAAFKTGLLQNPYPQSESDQQRQLQALIQFKTNNLLAQINIPTLVIAAENDILSPVMQSKKLADKIRNAAFITIPGGHASPVEQPNILSEIISKFFS